MTKSVVHWKRNLTFAVLLSTALLFSACVEEMRHLVNAERYKNNVNLLSAFCPNDLAAAAFGTADTSAKQKRFVPPSPEELAKFARDHNKSQADENNQYKCLAVILSRGNNLSQTHEREMRNDRARNIILSKKWVWVGTALAPDGLGFAYSTKYFAGNKESCQRCAVATTLGAGNESAESDPSDEILTLEIDLDESATEADQEELTTSSSFQSGVQSGDQSLAGARVIEWLRGLSPDSIREGLSNPAIRDKAFDMLLTGESGASARLTTEQINRAEETIERLAQQHPSLRAEMLEGWREYKIRASQRNSSRRLFSSAVCCN